MSTSKPVVGHSFAALLTTFAKAVQANDGPGLVGLFTEDGVYEDGFFGSHSGRPAIAAMLHRFHDTGSSYLWEFVDPVSNGAVGYARFRFSYASRLQESLGRPVLFEGISCFRFRSDLIARYSEAFDRGAALVQLGFPAERIRRILAGLLPRKTSRPRPAGTSTGCHLSEGPGIISVSRRSLRLGPCRRCDF